MTTPAVTPSISTRLLIVISVIISFLGVASISLINWQMKAHARQEAQERAMILLDRNLSTHTYFSHQLKPALFRQTDGLFKSGYFEPTWMSSTYAVREIDKYYRSLSGISTGSPSGCLFCSESFS